MSLTSAWPRDMPDGWQPIKPPPPNQAVLAAKDPDSITLRPASLTPATSICRLLQHHSGQKHHGKSHASNHSLWQQGSVTRWLSVLSLPPVLTT
jgi:hypothetical protein